MLLKMKKNNRNKVLTFVILLVFMLQHLAVSISFAEEVNLQVTEMNTTIDGKSVENYDFVANPLKTSAKLKIIWKFDFFDDVTTDGAIGFLPLPEGFDFSPFSSWKQGNGFQYQYDSTEKKMALKFPKDTPASTGNTLELEFDFNLNTSQTQTEYTYTFPLSNGSTKDVTIKFKPDIPPGQNASVHKYQGEPLKNGTVVADGFNADGVRWQIDVNKGLDKITAGSVLEDTFASANLKLKTGSLKVQGLNVALDGTTSIDATTTLTEPADYTLTDNGTGGFSLTLVNESARAYRITYDTDIADTSLATTLNFKNRASFGGNSSEATASTSRAETLEKTGELYRAGAVATDGVNPDSIRWTVTINKSESNITNAFLKDILPAGLEAPAATDIQVKKYELNNGAIDPSTETPVSVSPEISGSTITVPLGDISKTHVITFTTKITDFTKTSFTNKAELYGNGQTGALLSIEKTVDHIIHGAMLEKDGKSFPNYGNDGYIDWTVDVNKSQRPMKDGAVVTDTLPLGLELDTSSITVKELTITKGSSGVTATEGADVSDFTSNSSAGNATTFPKLKLNFGSPGDKAYRIAYRTKILDPNQTSFKNNVSVAHGWEGYDIVTKTVTKSIDNLVSKSNGSSGINYNTKTMDWKLTTTPARAPMKNLAITDTYPNKGLRFKTTSLIVTSNGNTLTKDTDYTFALTYETPGDSSSAETGFTINLIGSYATLSHPLKITYTTDFDRIYHANYPSGNTDNYTNSAKFEWTEGTDTTIKSKSATHQYSVSTTPSNANASKRGEIFGIRRDRTLKWYVDVNYLGNTLDPFTVSDTINDGQELITDSIEVFSYTRKSDGSILYNTTPVSDTAGIYTISKKDLSSFEIRFNKIDKPYSVQFKTKLKGLTQASYNNTATVDGKSVSAKQAISYADINEKFIEKSGKQLTGTNAYSIEWKAKLNTSLSEIKNAKIIDSLSAGQEYDPDSFKLYKMTASNTKTLVNSTEYTLVFSASDGKQSFVLHLDNDINDDNPVTIQDEYLLEYTSTVTKKEAIAISNKILLEGEGIEKGNQTATASTFTFNVSSTGSLGVPITKTGKVNIVKTDADGSTPMKDVTFQLLKKSDNSVMDKKMTDTAGKLTFSSLPYGDYILREKVPAGYQTVADKEFTVAKTSLTFDYSIDNYLHRKLQVKKVDNNNETKVLKDAVFALKNNATGIEVSSTTGEDGIATFDKLNFGDYTLREVTPPRGYHLNSQTELVTINKDKMLYEILFKNQKRSSSSSSSPSSVVPDPLNPANTTPLNLANTTPLNLANNIPVNPINTTIGTPIDGLVTINDGDVPLVTLPPQNGTVTINDNKKWTYKPNPGFKGKDKFTITITHPDGTTEDVLVEIDVEDIPTGTPIINKKSLPTTGGVPAEYFYGTGIFALLGTLLLKKKK